MNTIIWISKSFYKMLVILMLVEIMDLKQDWWYDTIIILGFIVSVFSSIPFSKDK